MGMSGSRQEATAEVEARLDYLITAVQGGMPESWDGDASAESLIIDYVRVLERRVLALGGSLERHPEDGDGAPLPDAGDSPGAYAAAVRGGYGAPLIDGTGITAAMIDVRRGPTQAARGAKLEDRRQRAREAGLDAYSGVLAVPSGPERAAQAVDDAIETATRVRVTPEVLAAYQGTIDTTTAKLKAAFRAAGFEVEQ